MTHDSLAHRLLIVGWDAADWKMIDPLLAAGDMPNLKHLIDSGVRADLASLDPKLSPILWTSIATGKTADKHGILNFIEPDPGGSSVRIVSSTSRKTKALWNMLSQSGQRALVVNWYASHPVEPIAGSMVSNLFQSDSPTSSSASWEIPHHSVHPTSSEEVIRSRRVHPQAVALHELRSMLPKYGATIKNDRRVSVLKSLMAQCRSVHQVAVALLQGSPEWRCSMVFYDMIDVAGHHFMQYHPPRMAHVSKKDFEAFSNVMTAVYRLHDRMLGELMNAAGDATVIVLSDHGFYSDHLRPTQPSVIEDVHAAMDATWHRDPGVLIMAGPGIQPGAHPANAGLLDIAPTALTLLGLPVGEDMDGRVLVESLAPCEILRIQSWDTLPGDAGLHPPEMSTSGFESIEALRQLADLGYIQPISDDLDRVLRDLDKESRWNLGVVYLTSRRPRLALPIFESLHSDHPNDVRFAMNLAHCQQICGRLTEATETLDEFLRGNPHVPSANLLHAVLLSTRGMHDAAIAKLESQIRTSPGNLELLMALADANRAAGRLDAADELLVGLLTSNPKHFEAVHGRALIALERHQFESAAEFALTALEIKRQRPEAHYTLGVALAWLDECEDAIQSFELALTFAPGMIEAHEFLALLHRRVGNPAAERTHREAVDRLQRGHASVGDVNAPRESIASPQRWAAHRGLTTNVPQ